MSDRKTDEGSGSGPGEGFERPSGSAQREYRENTIISNIFCRVLVHLDDGGYLVRPSPFLKKPADAAATVSKPKLGDVARNLLQ